MSYPVSTFFDAAHCPGCRAPISGGGPDLRCAHCGLPLGGPGADRLAGLLADADRTLAELRCEQANRSAEKQDSQFEGRRSDALANPPTTTPVASRIPPYPNPAPSGEQPRRLPAIGGAAILLGLGGLCLVVAAIVFLSMSWTTLSLDAKVAVLAGVTGLLAAVATTVTRRQLLGSAEALWAITLIDLALDVWAARRADLAGLHAVSSGAFSATGSVLVAGAALGCLLAVRRCQLGRPLVSVQLVFATSSLLATLQTTALADAPAWFALGLATIVLVALAIAARTYRFTIIAWALGAGALLPWLGLVGAGIGQIALGEFVPQLWHGQACELPAAIALAALAAAAEPILKTGWARIGAATSAIGLTAVTLGAIAAHYLPLPEALAVVVLVLGAARLPRHPVWRPAGAIVLAVSLLVDGVLLAEAALTAMVTSLDPSGWWWQRSAQHPVMSWQLFGTMPMLALLVAVCLAALANRAVLAQSGRWILVFTVLAAVAISLGSQPNVLVATLTWLAAAALTAALAGLLHDRSLTLAPTVALAAALLIAPASDLVSLIAFGSGALLLIVLGSRLIDAEYLDAHRAIELGAVAQLFVAVAAGAHRVQPSDGTPAVAGLLVCATVFAIGALLSPSRRWWQWLAVTAVTAASWIEAATHQVHAVELYSVPLGVLVLAFGVRAGRRDRALPSWLAYGPGLLVATVPTTLIALEQPLTWRASAACLVALVMLGVGYRQQLQAPLLIAATELAMLVLREAGPYALAMPRWAGIGALGLLLLAVGISWENRLGNLRRAHQQLAGMR
jgi:hypothetical protein